MTDFDVIVSSRTGQEVVRIAAEDGDAAIASALAQNPGAWCNGISPATPDPKPAPRPKLTLPVAASFNDGE